MISPFNGRFRITSPRGYRSLFGKKEYHKGIDIVADENTTVYAVADGIAKTLCEPNGFGNYIRQTLPDGRRIYYGHLKSFKIKNGETVKMGQPIGVMGATGKVTGAHLHLELRPKGTTSTSLDICEYTGIPNAVGSYNGKISGFYSTDETVDRLIRCGITTAENARNWELMLKGDAPLNAEYVRALLNRCCDKILNT